MSHSQRQAHETDQSRRAARLRDNKRRHRQRQKDYISTLETRLRELESQGVQATQEVQLSARKVVLDNTRLKALLRYVGVDDHVIESWTPPSKCEKKARKCTGTSKNERKGIASIAAPAEHKELVFLQSEHASLPTNTRQPENQKLGHDENNAHTEEKPTTPIITLPPCKVLTRLAEDPGADITQLAPGVDNSDEQENGGIECSKAHAMLTQLATTDKKLEIVSQALERGCVGKKGGGCKVRNEVMWKAIDEIT